MCVDTMGLCNLQEEDGATLLVSAKFSVVSVRNIYLRFEEVSFPSYLITYGIQGMGAQLMSLFLLYWLHCQREHS